MHAYCLILFSVPVLKNINLSIPCLCRIYQVSLHKKNHRQITQIWFFSLMWMTCSCSDHQNCPPSMTVAYVRKSLSIISSIYITLADFDTQTLLSEINRMYSLLLHYYHNINRGRIWTPTFSSLNRSSHGLACIKYGMFWRFCIWKSVNANRNSFSINTHNK